MCSFTIILINVDIYGLTCLRSEKGGVNILRDLLTFEKYETTNYNLSGKRRYSQNILQWNKNDMNSMKMTNGDFW